MHTLTVKQPYASLIVLGLKRLETRSWQTRYRGVLHIHASRKPDLDGWTPEVAAALAPFGATDLDQLATGMVLGRCLLSGCYSHEELAADGDVSRMLTPFERSVGHHGPGRFAWWLTCAHVLHEPFPASGKLGIWQAKRPKEAAHAMA